MKLRLVDYYGEYVMLYADGRIASDLSYTDIVTRISNVDKITKLTFDMDFQDQMQQYSGKTLLVVHDNNTIEISDLNFLVKLLAPEEFPYYTIKEFCELNNKGRAIVQRSCKEGDIEGAISVGNTWLIPKTSSYPLDKRRKENKKK